MKLENTAFVKWLQKNNLSHLVISLGIFYPFLVVNQYIGGNEFTTALMISYGYYVREVTQGARFGLFGSLAPWKWPYHDMIQTVYVLIGMGVTAGAFSFAYLWGVL